MRSSSTRINVMFTYKHDDIYIKLQNSGKMSAYRKDYGDNSIHTANNDVLDAPRGQHREHSASKQSHISGLLMEYNMKHSERGQAIIINNRDFHPSTQQHERVGTDVDANAMETCLMRLGFFVTRCDNLKCSEILRTLKTVSMEDHTQSDCFLCIVLSHGVDNRVFGTDGTITVNQLIEPFKGNNSPTLVGKPKLFFMQACRGTKYDRGVELPSDISDQDEVDAIQKERIPVEADFLLSYSVGPGYFSWRNSVDGSWYIQSLSKALEQHGDSIELLHLLTHVNHQVAYKYESHTGDEWTEGCKQVPSIVSQLTKLIYFRPKY